MQKIIILFLVLILGTALAVPIFADEIIDALNDTNSSFNDSGNNSSISDNSTLNRTTNSTLTQKQLQILNDTQTKLVALIAAIESLKESYGDNIKFFGLLNALNQFEKQANRLNETIDTYIQNSNDTNGSKGIINSFVKREAALEHKVEVKEQVLSKKSEKADNLQKVSKNGNNNQKQKENK
ncbi:MAG: hypothetical protein ACXVHY_05400 [Methanobacterium sp.]